jgi:glycosyltransferase involved in cell wall biosynthesis
MISFVIPAYNEELLLGRTLLAVNEAARPLGEKFEIVVADDASTDRTAAVAREHGARVVPVNHRQIAATRNAGARDASGEMLIFVDADTLVTAGAVHAAFAAMQAGAVGGGCAFRFDGRLPLYGRLMEAMAAPLYRVLGLASGCFLFCTRLAFRSAGGFDERLFGAEEAALSRALRRQGRFVVLRETVTTSGRKLRAHSAREVLGLLARLALAGPGAIRQRKGLEIWYGERRPDPEAAAPVTSAAGSCVPGLAELPGSQRGHRCRVSPERHSRRGVKLGPPFGDVLLVPSRVHFSLDSRTS